MTTPPRDLYNWTSDSNYFNQAITPAQPALSYGLVYGAQACYYFYGFPFCASYARHAILEIFTLAELGLSAVDEAQAKTALAEHFGLPDYDAYVCTFICALQVYYGYNSSIAVFAYDTFLPTTVGPGFDDVNFSLDADSYKDELEELAYGNVSDYEDVYAYLSILNENLGASVSIGSAEQQCEDAPAVTEVGLELGLIAIPVYYCAVGAIIVSSTVITLSVDVLDILVNNNIFGGGRATTPAPYDHIEERSAYHFVPDPFGDNCPRPQGDGSFRREIQILRANIIWRRIDLNPDDKVKYPGHLKRIKLLERKLRTREADHLRICGVEA